MKTYKHITKGRVVCYFRRFCGIRSYELRKVLCCKNHEDLRYEDYIAFLFDCWGFQLINPRLPYAPRSKDLLHWPTEWKIWYKGRMVWRLGWLLQRRATFLLTYILGKLVWYELPPPEAWLLSNNDFTSILPKRNLYLLYHVKALRSLQW